MTARIAELTQRLHSYLIVRKYPKLGYVPCRQCEEPIELHKHRKIVFKGRGSHIHKSRHYHVGCARLLKII